MINENISHTNENIADQNEIISQIETTPTNIKSKRKFNYGAKFIPLSKIISLRQQNMSAKEIANILNCSESNIYNRLKDCEQTKDFGDNADYFFEKLQKEVIDSIDADCIDKASLQSRIWSVAVLEDKKRLIRGKSTQNISIRQAILHLSKSRKQETVDTIT